MSSYHPTNKIFKNVKCSICYTILDRKDKSELPLCVGCKYEKIIKDLKYIENKIKESNLCYPLFQTRVDYQLNNLLN